MNWNEHGAARDLKNFKNLPKKSVKMPGSSAFSII
jgi:hypothetical protein